MEEITLLIRWPKSVETIHLGNLDSLKNKLNQPLITLERWKGYPQKTRYEASLEGRTGKNGVTH